MPDWKTEGIRVVRAGTLDTNTPQTPGMSRAAAITHATTGASKLWAGTVVVDPNARTAAHHHGELETVLYIVRGHARFRWGDHLEYSEDAYPGDFIYVPPWVPHQEMNADPNDPVEAVIVRSGQDPIVVNLDIAEASVFPVPFHPRPGN
ncbi:MAG TPA: cupin domain-containing protein [Bryobacteraceae bacterium]|nr:cupin domain-containing protein [Bryobacteraceae bacterium]